MAISLKNIRPSDTLSSMVDKINYNFDQLILSGGGPSGPRGSKGYKGEQGLKGEQGIQGIQGLTGQRGSIWFTFNGVISSPSDITKSAVSPQIDDDFLPGDMCVDNDCNIYSYTDYDQTTLTYNWEFVKRIVATTYFTQFEPALSNNNSNNSLTHTLISPYLMNGGVERYNTIVLGGTDVRNWATINKNTIFDSGVKLIIESSYEGQNSSNANNGATDGILFYNKNNNLNINDFPYIDITPAPTSLQNDPSRIGMFNIKGNSFNVNITSNSEEIHIMDNNDSLMGGKINIDTDTVIFRTHRLFDSSKDGDSYYIVDPYKSDSYLDWMESNGGILNYSNRLVLRNYHPQITGTHGFTGIKELPIFDTTNGYHVEEWNYNGTVCDREHSILYTNMNDFIVRGPAGRMLNATNMDFNIHFVGYNNINLATDGKDDDGADITSHISMYNYTEVDNNQTNYYSGIDILSNRFKLYTPKESLFNSEGGITLTTKHMDGEKEKYYTDVNIDAKVIKLDARDYDIINGAYIESNAIDYDAPDTTYKFKLRNIQSGDNSESFSHSHTKILNLGTIDENYTIRLIDSIQQPQYYVSKNETSNNIYTKDGKFTLYQTNKIKATSFSNTKLFAATGISLVSGMYVETLPIVLNDDGTISVEKGYNPNLTSIKTISSKKPAMLSGIVRNEININPSKITTSFSSGVKSNTSLENANYIETKYELIGNKVFCKVKGVINYNLTSDDYRFLCLYDINKASNGGNVTDETNKKYCVESLLQYNTSSNISILGKKTNRVRTSPNISVAPTVTTGFNSKSVDSLQIVKYNLYPPILNTKFENGVYYSGIKSGSLHGDLVINITTLSDTNSNITPNASTLYYNNKTIHKILSYDGNESLYYSNTYNEVSKNCLFLKPIWVDDVELVNKIKSIPLYVKLTNMLYNLVGEINNDDFEGSYKIGSSSFDPISGGHQLNTNGNTTTGGANPLIILDNIGSPSKLQTTKKSDSSKVEIAYITMETSSTDVRYNQTNYSYKAGTNEGNLDSSLINTYRTLYLMNQTDTSFVDAMNGRNYGHQIMVFEGSYCYELDELSESTVIDPTNIYEGGTCVVPNTNITSNNQQTANGGNSSSQQQSGLSGLDDQSQSITP